MRGLAREEKALCGSNLGPGGQNKRLRMGVVFLAVGLGLSIFLVQADVTRWFRLVLFIPFTLAMLGAMQGLYRTCPGHVKGHTRENEADGLETVVNPEEITKGRMLSRKLLTASFAASLACTALVFFLP